MDLRCGACDPRIAIVFENEKQAISFRFIGGLTTNDEYELTPEELESLNAALAAIDWEHLPGPFDDLTAALNLREVTTDELSRILGISDRRISQLWRAGIIPEHRHDGKRHWFPLLQSVNMYIQFLKDR